MGRNEQKYDNTFSSSSDLCRNSLTLPAKVGVLIWLFACLFVCVCVRVRV